MIPFFLNLDHHLFCLINLHHSPFWDHFFWTISWLGNGWVVTPILVVLALIKVPRKKYLVFFIVATGGIIASSLINTQIKNMAQRDRPIGYFITNSVHCPGAQNGTYSVHVVGAPLACRSFPSGHTNTAFCAAALLAFFFGRWYWLAFAPALLVGYSRIYMGVHFPTDVAVGAALALVVLALTRFLYSFILKKQERR
jgi:undecaprenyl-diphosphatase